MYAAETPVTNPLLRYVGWYIKKNKKRFSRESSLTIGVQHHQTVLDRFVLTFFLHVPYVVVRFRRPYARVLALAGKA